MPYPGTCCGPEELEQSSVVSKLLEIARSQSPNDKSSSFIRTLTCLRVNQDGNYSLRLETQDATRKIDRDYVAVSYCWEPSIGLDRTESGKYRVKDTEGRYLRRTKVRDELLIRVIRYARCNKVTRIWIDQECILQEDEEAKRIAMDCMDSVYRCSNWPIGLLSVVLESQQEIDVLQNLLRRAFVQRGYDYHFPRLSDDGVDNVEAIMAILESLYEDRWWDRAWIFQEEYLSATAMHILVRHERGLKVDGDFCVSHGELCFKPAAFRHEATLFLLACKREISPAMSWSCARMLERFGRYELLYRFQPDTMGKAMSARIFADVQRRALKCCYDRLPIAANSCDYAIRLHPQAMSRSGHSVGLCLLALYLINGEVLRDSEKITKLPTEMDLSSYLQYISFNGFDPPVGEKHLTYLKESRLHRVSLNDQGVSTFGHLWTIEAVVQTRGWLNHWRRLRRRRRWGLDDAQRRHLGQALCKSLRRNSRQHFLPATVSRYFRKATNVRDPPRAVSHMDLMAETVAEAIRAGEPLFIAKSRGSADACAVFVGVQNTRFQVFTSWHAGMDCDNRVRERHVSLGVSVETGNGTPLVRTMQWVNGSAFFEQRDQIEVIFGWPKVWSTIPKSARSGANST